MSAKPSIPKTKLMFMESNHELVSKNWKSTVLKSKVKSKRNEKFKIIKDQNKEKLRIKTWFVLSQKLINKQAKRGKLIRKDNIVKKRC